MPRFPSFFEDHAVLPAGVKNPMDRTDWESEVIRRLARDEGSGLGAPWFKEREEERPVLVGVSDDDTGADLEPLDDDGQILWKGWREDVEADRHRSVDAIAWYQPWHLYGDDWGIFFDGRLWRTRVRRFARALQPHQNISSDEIERHVFDQILAHERTHFASEVLGTELEAIAGRSGYRDYVLTAYSFRNPWTTGAPEEILATHNEVNGGRAGVLRDTAKRLAHATPPGYADWERASDQRERRVIEPSIAAKIMHEAGADVDWPTEKDLGKQALNAVPVYWYLGGVRAPGFLRRSIARLTPQAVRRYLRSQGFTGGRIGHHEMWRRDSCVVGFSVQGNEIPLKEHSSLAQHLGFTKPIELRRAMSFGTPPPALAALGRHGGKA